MFGLHGDHQESTRQVRVRSATVATAEPGQSQEQSPVISTNITAVATAA